MAKITRSPGIERPFDDVFPVPVIATKAPASTDTKFPLGQIWVRRDTAQIYILAQLASGAASWTLASPGASDVDTLTGDSGGAISPLGGNITLAGGTNVTSVGAANTITFNLDDAITLATSVTSPIYTTAAAADMMINAAAGQDIIIQMGDDAGTNKISFEDDGDVEVASIDSDGNLAAVQGTFSGDIIMSSVATQLQMNGGAVTDFIGQATLVSGTVTVANTNIAANDRIFLTRADANSSTALGELTVTAQTASTSFVITALDPSDGSSTITGDVSIVNYFIVRQN